MDQQAVKWRVVQGRHVKGGARKKGHPTPRLDQPEQRVGRTPGQSVRHRSKRQEGIPLDRNIQGTWTCEPGLEHPGQTQEIRGLPPGQERTGEEGERPRTGSSRTERKGGARSVPTTVSNGDKLLGWSKLSRSTVETRRQATGMEQRSGKKGQKPRTRASGTEQRGKKAATILRTIEGTGDRRHGLVRPGQSKAAREQPTGLEHPEEKGERPWTGPCRRQTKNKQYKYSRGHTPRLEQLEGGRRTWRRGKKPWAGASRTKQSGTQGNHWTDASRGSRLTAPDRPGVNTKEELIRCLPQSRGQAPRAGAPRADQRRRNASTKIGACGERGQGAPDRTRPSSRCQRGEIAAAGGQGMGHGSSTIQRVRGAGAKMGVEIARQGT